MEPTEPHSESPIPHLESDDPAEITRVIGGHLEWPRPVHSLDWSDLPSAEDSLARLELLASVQVRVPLDNIEMQKDTHNHTVENHLKLVLEAAGTTQTLATFLELADRQMRTGTNSAKKLAEQAFLLWAPAADIIGREDLKERLEQTAFEILQPEANQLINDTYADLGGDGALIPMIKEFREVVEGAAAEMNPEVGPRIQAHARKKSNYSIWRKCQRGGRESYRLPDYIGMRVIVPSDSDEMAAIGTCYAVAGEINELFDPVKSRYKDYIKLPKSNGYRSLHLTVRSGGAPLEVQIRTSAMHDQAERDPNQSHLGYDAAKFTPGKFHRKRLPVRSKTYQWRDVAARLIASRPDGSLENLRDGEVLAFTPDGNCYNIVGTANWLDLSFRIHGERAIRTKNVFVDGQIRPFDETVSNGRLVEVEYGPKPPVIKSGWAELATTSRAKRAVKRAIKKRDSASHEARGRELIENEFEGIKNPLGLLTERDWLYLRKKYSVGTSALVLREIGSGDRTPDKLVGHIKRALERQAE